MSIKLLSFLLLIPVLTFGQSTTFDIQKISAELRPDISTKSISGKVVFTFKALTDTDSIYLDAVGTTATLLQSDTSVMMNTGPKKIWFVGKFANNTVYTISFSYRAKPKQALYFVGFDDKDKRNDQIFTQGQGKYTSHWLPSIDDMNDKIEFDLSIIVPRFYGAVASGKLTEQWRENDSLNRWVYDMENPMSSYLVALSVGDYHREIEFSASGVELHQYMLKKDSLYFEPTFRHTKSIFDFLEQKIGVPYPWQNYKQVPVRDFLYAGMENTSLTIFSDTFVTDSIGFNDRNYINVNAHELAHQWFGDLVTETSSSHHWLHEGFATYYALLAERQIFGEDYFYHRLYENAEALKSLSDKGKGEKLVNPKASSLTYYQKGAWALFILNQLVGTEVFDQAVRSYLNKNAFSNVQTSDFLSEVQSLTNVDLSSFEKDWLYQSAFKADEALEALKSAVFITPYFELIAKRPISLENKRKELSKAFSFPVNEYIAQEAVIQLPKSNLNDIAIQLYIEAFQTHKLSVRQTISRHLENIPQALQPYYEDLLNDESYVTRENALYMLWLNYPDKRLNYLDSMKGQIGFNDRNIELLWLTLNLATPNFQKDQTNEILENLEQYTSPQFRYQIRQNAFGYLYQIDAFNQNSIRNLIHGCFHHTWRFRSYCRQLLKTLSNDKKNMQVIATIKTTLTEQQQTLLGKIL